MLQLQAICSSHNQVSATHRAPSANFASATPNHGLNLNGRFPALCRARRLNFLHRKDKKQIVNVSTYLHGPDFAGERAPILRNDRFV